MSFVYAKKIGNQIAVYADTKITFDPDRVDTILSRDAQQAIHEFGLIKNIIISKNYCVSFAGNNIIFANEFLSKIIHSTLEELITVALEINQRDTINGAEFIICYADHKQSTIVEIKDGRAKNVPVAWIGSYSAFNYFQSINLGNTTAQVKSNNPNGVEISFGVQASSMEEKEYNRLFDLFHKTIFDSSDNEVGGFVIPVWFDYSLNQFVYKEYMKSYSVLQIRQGTAHLPMYQDATSGTFSVLFYRSTNIVGIYLPQNNLGIIYNHFRKSLFDSEIKQTSEFHFPNTTKISQLDFYVQTSALGMSPPGFLGYMSEDIEEYLKRVWHYKEKPTLAILYIDKVIEIIQTQHREEHRLDELLNIRNNIAAGLKTTNK